MQNVVWPFCVTGCLATEEQQLVLRDMVITAAGVPSPRSIMWSEALKIVEECWTNGRLHASRDWTCAMTERGKYVLLW